MKMIKIRGRGDTQCGTHSVVNFELPPVAEAQWRPGENNHHVHEEDVLHAVDEEDDCHPGTKEII